jgi:putative tricarboxylic transport membrane protein
MSEETHVGGGSGPSHRSVEVGVAIAMLVFSLIVIAGSLQVGVGWASDGPAAGFFPFYCAMFIFVASVINLVNAVSIKDGALFAEWGQIGQVISVVIPSAIYVALVPWVGMYVASVFLIAFFMRRLGHYGWPMVIGVSIPVMIATFIIFERWFLVPLPKGPIEEMLGF